MTARGAADFLTRLTSVLGATFIVLSIVMAAIAGATREPTKIDTSLAGKAAPLQQPKPLPGQPGAPAQPGAIPVQPVMPAPSPAPQQNQGAPAVPLAQ
jgi:preprotein translocase subunit SecG